MSSTSLLLVLVMLCQLMMGIAYASGSNSNNGANIAPQAESRASHPGASHSGAAIPRINSVEEICQWLCQSQNPCPPSCNGGVLGAWSKRAARGRRFNEDFSFGFDDYLFMKLLGRDLGDRV